jgi:citrate-Mg2+:H+ or citrate-Ca2+:H+ symporter, CitMHS family
VSLDKRVLACAASMAAGVKFLPWTGPMIRASASLKLPIREVFNPLVPIQVIGLIFIFTVAWWLGRREERRLGLAKSAVTDVVPTRTPTEAEKVLRRPQSFWVNIVLTIVVLGTMVALGDKLAPAIVFMVGTCLALLITGGGNHSGERRGFELMAIGRCYTPPLSRWWKVSHDNRPGLTLARADFPAELRGLAV